MYSFDCYAEFEQSQAVGAANLRFRGGAVEICRRAQCAHVFRPDAASDDYCTDTAGKT